MTDGAGILDEAAGMLRRYVVFPSDHCFTAAALWAAHTHASSALYVTPRLVLDSAEPGSGKTRVLEVLRLLVHAPIMSISTTTAALYRRLAEGPRTVLLDETDAIFGKVSSPQHEDLRALINSGYKRGATVDRCVGDGSKMKVVEFPVFAPVALAGIAGNMPATITTRSVTIHMRKRAPGETVTPFRERDAEVEAAPIRGHLAEWIGGILPILDDARPVMPAGVVDRPAECWEALIAIADEAGGKWPEAARAACRYFVLGQNNSAVSLGVRLLQDLRTVYGTRDRMTTADVLDALTALEEAPWSDMHGKALDARRLARELARYGVVSKDLKQPNGAVVKGYRIDGETGLLDAWSRYLLVAATGATAATSQVNPVADENEVADTSATAKSAATHLSRQVAAVAPVAANTGVCKVCGFPMADPTPNVTVHPGCEPVR